MQFSEKFKKEAKKYDLPPETILMADLIALGYTQPEAYNIAYTEREVFDIQKNMSHRDGILADQKFKVMLEDRIQRVKSGITITEKLSEIELMTREEALKEILRSAKKLPEGSKERGEMFIKYQENQAKLQGDGEKTDSVQIYLPLKCVNCQLYQDFVERQAEKIEEKHKNE